MSPELGFVLLVTLLWGPTALWLVYRTVRWRRGRPSELFTAVSKPMRGSQLAPDELEAVVGLDRFWVCWTCRSLNRRDANRCYGCRTLKDSAGPQAAGELPVSPGVPVMADGIARPSSELPVTTFARPSSELPVTTFARSSSELPVTTFALATPRNAPPAPEILGRALEHLVSAAPPEAPAGVPDGQAADPNGPAGKAQNDTGRLRRERRPARADAVDPLGETADTPGAWARGWRWIILVGAASTALLVAIDASGPLRAVVTIGFLVVCPGMSLIRLIDLGDLLAETTLAIATSLALTGLVAGTLLYLGLWSPRAGSAIVITITLSGLAADLLRERRDVRAVVRGFASRFVGAMSVGLSPSPGPTTNGPQVRPRPGGRTATPVRDPRGKRSPLGSDPLESPHSRLAVATSIERAIGELARRRDDPPQ